MRGRGRTRATDQETVVLVNVGGVDLFDDVVAVKGKGDVCVHQRPPRSRCTKRPPDVIRASDEDKSCSNMGP